MKRFKKIYILLGVLAAACLATFLIFRIEQKKEQIKATEAVVLAVDPETVTALSWSYDETSLAFTKTDDVWHWSEDEAFPVSEEKVNDLLSMFEEFGVAFEIDDVEDFSQYGLDKPTCTIHMEAGEQSYDVTLGAFSTMDEERYVSVGDGKVYLVKDDPFDEYEIVLEDMIANDEIPTFTNISEVTFSGLENYTITRDEESTVSYCADDIYYTDKDGESLPLDPSRVENYCTDMTILDLDEYASYNVTDDELTAWGLADPELTVDVSYATDNDDDTTTPASFTLHVGRNQEELQAKADAEAAGEDYDGSVTCYVRVGDSQIVYTITTDEYNTLAGASVNDLRHHDILTADFDTVTEIDATLDGTEYALTSEENPDAEEDETAAARVYSYNGTELDITTLQKALAALTVREFTDETPEGKEEISLTFHLNDENHPEATLQLYRYNGTYCVAVLNGEVLGLLTRSSVVDVMEDIYSIVLG